MLKRDFPFCLSNRKLTIYKILGSTVKQYDCTVALQQEGSNPNLESFCMEMACSPQCYFLVFWLPCIVLKT